MGKSISGFQFICCLLTVVLFACSNAVAQTASSFQTQENRATAASQTTKRRAISIPTCHLRSIDDAQLASEFSGLLVAAVEPGQRVVAGQVLAQLDDSLAKARLAVAQKEAASDVEIRFAEKNHEFAQVKFERAMKAESSLTGTITEIEIKELRLAAEKSILQLEQAQNQYELAQLHKLEFEAAVRQKQIVAPFDGFVRAVHKRPGEVISEGELVIELINTERLEAEVHVNREGLEIVNLGSPVSVRVTSRNENASPQVLRGKVVFVDISLEPVSQKAKVRVEVPNPNGSVRSGMLASLTIFESQ